MSCSVCRRSLPTTPFTVGGRDLLGNYIGGEVSIGDVCDDACGQLLWLAHFERVMEAPSWEREITKWKWRKRIAEVNGRPFREPPPRSPVELEIDRNIAVAGLTDIAREVA